MANYPYMIQTAYRVLETVFKQWQTEPYRWLKERDLQAEIGGRLNQIFLLQGLGSFRAEYGWVAKGFEKQQILSRVSFEPYVAYQYKSEHAWCNPDIVIWDDLEGKKPPKYDQGEQWPILWACELKYGSKDDGSWDIEKLQLLLNQKIIRFGCLVRVHFISGATNTGFDWKGDPNLWIVDVTKPKSKSRS